MNDTLQHPEIDEETESLYQGEIKKFVNKGGFQKLLQDVPGGPIALDLNTYLPTLTDLGKLDCKTEWAVERLIVKQAINTLTSPGGLFKTTVSMQIGTCVEDGRPFAGQKTQKMPVWYIDFENPLSLVCDKARINGPSEMGVWHLSNPFPPPRLDTEEDWKLYKALMPGLLIFDTLRSAQLLDENSSKDMALIMNRLKELREFGHTILLIHHAPKANERTYKGSTAISDLSDHCLVLERVRRVGSEETVDDADDNDFPLRLGVRGKTRFEPFAIFLRFDPCRGLCLASDPNDELLLNLQDLLEDRGLNQSEFFKQAKDNLEMRRGKFLWLLRKGEGRFWTKSKSSWRNQTVYRSVVPNQNQLPNPQLFKNTELSSCSGSKRITETTASCSVVPSCFPPLRGEPLETMDNQLEAIGEGGLFLKGEEENLPWITDEELGEAVKKEEFDEGE